MCFKLIDEFYSKNLDFIRKLIKYPYIYRKKTYDLLPLTVTLNNTLIQHSENQKGN